MSNFVNTINSFPNRYDRPLQQLAAFSHEAFLAKIPAVQNSWRSTTASLACLLGIDERGLSNPSLQAELPDMGGVLKHLVNMEAFFWKSWKP